ncbi:methionyl-tRNA formyltransferase [Malaciobacter molluscorum LMG 25693]|uniref:Formyltransferase domain-containing protein n=1 Tax=Malaciobacter molluscorum LMG 25693 TaxID=870501 RepID=A0A2G1DFM0_9BACT|nr:MULTISPECIES: formyltransferase family protein [Arcobacteraceae]AXX93554.1 formyltransferase domain-containing protein [Malaciobacter molluscorum LMG 25693]PHO17291.1 methionyl-tRNA formyltransferase [Malaciobacter molluscorum LMG 25693]RXJ86223.1 methionyl-tRNA formyltransferase [Arcobacter sp. CECT 8985]
MKIAILTSPNQWFIDYAKELAKELSNCELFFDHKKMASNYKIVFILSYHKIIEEEYLKKNEHNIVVHASALPKGKGWSPLFWQVLEGKNDIPFTMFEASCDVDEGSIYMQKILNLDGTELNPLLRHKQAQLVNSMCKEFVSNYEKYNVLTEQIGKESFYKKRTPLNSQLDINKTINEQFNLLRVVDNEEYPAFFYKNDKKYILKIELSE